MPSKKRPKILSSLSPNKTYINKAKSLSNKKKLVNKPPIKEETVKQPEKSQPTSTEHVLNKVDYGRHIRELGEITRQSKSVLDTIHYSVAIQSFYTVHKIFTAEQEVALRDYIIDCSNAFYGMTSADYQRIAYHMARINNISPMPRAWVLKEMASKDWMRGFEARHKNEMLERGNVGNLKRYTFDEIMFYQELKNLKPLGEPNVWGSKLYIDETLKTTVKPLKMEPVVKLLNKHQIKSESSSSTHYHFVPWSDPTDITLVKTETRANPVAGSVAKIPGNSMDTFHQSPSSILNNGLEQTEHLKPPIKHLQQLNNLKEQQEQQLADINEQFDKQLRTIKEQYDKQLIDMNKQLEVKDTIIKNITQDRNAKIKCMREKLSERNNVLKRKNLKIKELTHMHRILYNKNRTMKLIFTKMKRIMF